MFSSKKYGHGREQGKTLNSETQWLRASGAATRSSASQPWREPTGGSESEGKNHKDHWEGFWEKERSGREKYSEESEKDPGNMSEGKTEETRKKSSKGAA